MRQKTKVNWNVAYTLIVLIMLYAVVVGLLYFTIVGIKYTFDSEVHIGVIDWVVCCVIPYYVVRCIYHVDKKFGRDFKLV